jgi:hypothetical protein
VSKFKELFVLVTQYRYNLLVNVICNVLNAILSLFTFLSVVPFLRILFTAQSETTSAIDVESLDGLERWGSMFDQFVAEEGATSALAWICGGIVLITLLKKHNWLFRAFQSGDYSNRGKPRSPSDVIHQNSGPSHGVVFRISERRRD